MSGTDYAARLGIDYSDPLLRSDLVASWGTVTPRRLVLHQQKQTAIRPRPGVFIEAIPIDGVVLRYFDAEGLGLSNRVLNLDFADGRRLLSATMLKATIRRKNFTAEPDLFVRAFGDRATEVEHG